jgi:subtilisin family serine protease
MSNIDQILQSTGIFHLWGRKILGEGTKILILDTGVSDNISTQYNIDRRVAVSSMNPLDIDGHGTAIAKLILSICPSAKIESLKILNSFSDGNIWNFIAGMTSLYDKHNLIVNLSIGIVPTYFQSLGSSTNAFRETLINLINSAASNGNFLISSAGNDGLSQLRWPAAAENVLAVGSHNLSFQLSSFSNHMDSRNFILSLGGDMRKFDHKIESLGTYGPGLSRDILGTSFSSAIATGISGLLTQLSWFHQMPTPSKISLFRNHCRKNEAGYPILNLADIGAIWPL